VRSIQHRQGLLIGCLEEIAYTKGLISESDLRNLAGRYDKTAYGRYLRGWSRKYEVASER